MQERVPRWRRRAGNPILPPVPGTWREAQTANPDLLRLGDLWYLYFRGQQGGHDRIGFATMPVEDFDGVSWKVHPEPVVDVGLTGDWDEQHALDPATVRVGDTIFLYYSAVSSFCPRSICLATSTDGRRFTKYPGNPIVIGGGPEVAYGDGVFYLYYWKDRPGRKGFEIHCSTSTDGFRYAPTSPAPVLPAGRDGEWDGHTVETPRIFCDRGLYYMSYCGSDRYDDYPDSMGLATSRDLLEWRKWEGNPVFSRGAEGQWDEGAVWFTTVERIGGRYWMWYEGYGGGDARNRAYGSYLNPARSQIGLATLDAPWYFVRPPAGPPARALAHRERPG